MTRKTKQDLEKETTKLKEELCNLKNNFDILSVKYESLEVSHNRCMSKSKLIFKCVSCNQKFNKQGDLKEHVKREHASVRTFTCDECDMIFNEEWKLKAHIKSHKKYPCGYCDKIFNFKETLAKHTTAAHEQLKIYCHHYNNNTVCIYKDQCVFIHENSEECKYGHMCERKKCMYKHEGVENDLEEVIENSSEDDKKDANIKDVDSDDDDAMDKEDIEDAKNENEKVDNDDVHVDDYNDKKEDDDTVNMTFVNPSQQESEMVEFDVFVKCKDHWLRNDQSLYFQRLNTIPEIDRVENLWITPKKDYQVGSYLPTNIKFKTKFGNRFKVDEEFRHSIWKKLEFEETCPEQE